MNKDKLVSVIIPLYNHGSYVIETLESIYDSDYTELELLILDDGSNDNGFDLATDWLSDHSSRFVRVWSEKQNNSGINATTNKLVNNSKGYYIYLIASDDRVPCNAITKLVFAHEKAFKGKEGLLFYDVTTINENSEIIENSVSSRIHGSYLHSMSVDKDLLFMAICFKWEVPFQHQFYNRTFYDKIKGYPEALHFEDVYFALVATSTDVAAYAGGSGGSRSGAADAVSKQLASNRDCPAQLPCCVSEIPTRWN